MAIEDFVTTITRSFFICQGLPTEFLDYDPETWPHREDFRQCMKTVNHIRVVNDNAESGVALIEEYNSILTKKESQKQYLPQVVQDHQRQFPNCLKATLLTDNHCDLLLMTVFVTR